MKKIDLLLIGDLTGSMGQFHALLKNRFRELCYLISEAANLQIGIIFFLDHGSGDPYITKVKDLTSDMRSLEGFIKATPTGYGGDADEALEDAMHDALHNISWRLGSARSIVVFGDAFPHEQNKCPYGHSYFSLTKKLFDAGCVINTVYCNSASSSRSISTLVDINVGDFSVQPSRSFFGADALTVPGWMNCISAFFDGATVKKLHLTSPAVFFSWLANVTGGMAITAEQTEDLIDIIKIAAAKDSGGIQAINRLEETMKPKSKEYIKVAKEADRKRKMYLKSI